MKNLSNILFIPFLISGAVLLLFACSSKKQVQVAKELISESNEIEIFMEKGTSGKQLEGQFSEYGVVSKGMSSRSQNIAIIRFDRSKISGADLIEKLLESELVIAAKLLDGNTGGPQSGKSGKKKTVILNQ